MSVSIRLSRGGAKKRPYYRIVVANSRSPRDGSFIEKIGTYNPLLGKDDGKRIILDADRARHWLSVGAQPTDRVARFFDAAGIKERAARSNPSKGVPGDKARERAEERAAKAAEANEAAEAEAVAVMAEAVEEATPDLEAAAEAPAVEEAAVEEAPAAEAPAAEAAASTDAAPVAEATPADAATDEGVSAEAPAEGSDESTPAEGAEHAKA